MKILAKVSYFGKNFHGWQRQPDARSVQEEIEKVLSKILNKETIIYAAGRTDAKVHAKGQTFHFVTDKSVDLVKLRYSLNMLLTTEIHIESLTEVSDDFEARYSAKGKWYRYIINTNEQSPFLVDTTLFYPYKFDYDKFKHALSLFLGTHSFRNFTSKESDELDFVRTITSIDCKNDNGLITIDLKGDGFMRYMIRSIIGSSLAVASGKENESYITSNLTKEKRSISSYVVDGQGLYLMEVYY